MTLDERARAETSGSQNEATAAVVEGKFESMWVQPMLPIRRGDYSGLTSDIKVDHQGRLLDIPATLRYLPFTDLTDGKIQFVRVVLPDQVTRETFNATFVYQGTEYRFDAFGGNSSKPQRRSVWQQTLDPAMVWAVPLHETAPGTAFSDLYSKLLPNRQQFWYAQRAGFASAPNDHRSSEEQAKDPLDPRDHVLKGRLRIAYIPDGTECPFHIHVGGDPTKKVQLRCFDGHGFIKRSLMEKMPAYRMLLKRDDAGKQRRYLGDGAEGGRVPSQCLRYYPHDDEVVGEAMEAMKRSLANHRSQHPEEPLSADLLHRCLTSGNLQPQMSIAVPSADDNLYQPSVKVERASASPARHRVPDEPSTPHSGTSALLFRAPYIDQGIRAVPSERVKVADDTTASYLSEVPAIQYTLLTETRRQLTGGDKESGGKALDESPLLRNEDRFYSFHKGLFTVIPDEDWPADYQTVAVVMPSGDRKTHSHARGEKLTCQVETWVDTAALLVAIDMYAANSLVAVPTRLWTQLSHGDFDGDPIGVMNVTQQPGQYQKLFAFVQQHEQQRLMENNVNLKPPKELTSAFVRDDGGFDIEAITQLKSWLADPSDWLSLERAKLHLHLQIGDIARMKSDELPYRWLMLHRALRRAQWDVSEDSQKEVLQRWGKLKDETVRSSRQLIQQIALWLKPQPTIPSPTLDELQRKCWEECRRVEVPRDFAARLDLLDLIERCCRVEAAEQQRYRDRIESVLREIQVQREVFEFGRTEEFLRTRLGLVQSFERLQDMYCFARPEHRAAVGREIVRAFCGGISPGTRMDIQSLLSYPGRDTARRYASIMSRLAWNQDVHSEDGDVVRRIVALRQTLARWKACQDSGLAGTKTSSAPRRSRYEKIYAEKAVVDCLKQTPGPRSKVALDPSEDDMKNPGPYYERAAALWLTQGSYIGTDIYKTSAQHCESWDQMSRTANKIFRRLEHAGIAVEAPYSNTALARSIQYGKSPNEILRSLEGCDNLAAGLMRASIQYFQQPRLDVAGPARREMQGIGPRRRDGDGNRDVPPQIVPTHRADRPVDQSLPNLRVSVGRGQTRGNGF